MPGHEVEGQTVEPNVCRPHRFSTGFQTSQDALKWRYQQIVLAEPFHLSYPYVFEWMNDYYLVPESYQAGAIRLYRAAQFPFQWTFLGEILTGPYFADTSIFQHQGLWWLFTETIPP